MDPLALLESAGTELTPKIQADVIDKTNLSAGLVARFLTSELVKAGVRPWTKHTFAIPGGGHFALGGDKSLNGLMARLKQNDLVGLFYLGTQKNGDYDEHQWRAVMITKTGPELATLLGQFDIQNKAVREASELVRKKRLEQRRGSEDFDAFQQGDGYSHTDADAP